MSDISLQTGLRALLTARYQLDTIGHNLANANTPGYSRQRVDLETAMPLRRQGLLIGGGVDASSIQRSVDQLLNRRIFGQRSIGGGLEAQLGLMSEIEAFFGEPSENSLGSRMDSFFATVSQLSTSPSDSILRSATVQAAQTLTGQFNDLAGNLDRVRFDVIAEAQRRVDEVNDLAGKIAGLNLRVQESEANGITANDLRDERERLLNALSELVDVQTVEDQGGVARVLVAGNTLVGRASANEMSATVGSNGELAIQIDGARGFVPVKSGAIGGLLDFREEMVSALESDLDRLAKNLILQVNRVHSTGVPTDGPFSALTGANLLSDIDGDGKIRDELLSNAGLPFDVVSGVLDVNMTDSATGLVSKHRIEISATHTTVADFLDELNAIPDLSAELDAFGRLRILADAGHGFDFSRRIDPNPNQNGTLGGAQASLGSGAAGPFVLADGDTLDLTVDSGGGPVSFQITFDTADFREVSQATAEEIAAVVNADPGAQAAGMRAVVVGEQVFFQSVAEGSSAALSVDGGSAVDALGWTGQLGSTITGHEGAVEVRVGGSYSGPSDEVFHFRPRGDGTVGTTQDLVVDVFDDAGQLVVSLNVGEGYVPGDELPVAEGLTVSFGLGDLSASSNDAFALDAVVDSDTSDVLVALGMNALYTGTSASDISVREDLAENPALLASSLTGEAGDNSLLLELLDVESQSSSELEGQSLSRFYGDIVGGLGFEVSIATDAFVANATLVSSLEQRRDSISGVNADEELVDLVRYEQAFSAAAQFISVVNQLGDELLSLI